MKTIAKYLLPLLMIWGVSAWAGAHEMEMGGAHPAPQSDSLFNITDTWTTSEGKSFQLAELGGKPSVVAMIYTSCKDICPLVVEDMKKIERMLPASQKGKVNFAVFSFDPERDTPDRLKKYAAAHGIDSAPWVLLHGSDPAVRRLAVAMGLKYKKLKSGEFEHDVLITVLDSNGVIKYQQTALGKNADEAVRMLQQLAQ